MSLGKTYLLCYNAAQTVGWALLLAKALLSVLASHSGAAFYDDVATLLQIFQTAAVLEILHCAVGLVRSPVMLTAVQVFSRVSITWVVLALVPQSRSQIGFSMLLFAWSITEIIRYSFYALNLFDKVPRLLLWCRYSFFILLYPIGVMGELLSLWTALRFVCDNDMYAMRLPNAANISCSLCTTFYMALFMYVPFFPQLYGYMLKQRSKVLSPAAGDKKHT